MANKRETFFNYPNASQNVAVQKQLYFITKNNALSIVQVASDATSLTAEQLNVLKDRAIMIQYDGLIYTFVAADDNTLTYRHILSGHVFKDMTINIPSGTFTVADIIISQDTPIVNVTFTAEDSVELSDADMLLIQNAPATILCADITALQRGYTKLYMTRGATPVGTYTFVFSDFGHTHVIDVAYGYATYTYFAWETSYLHRYDVTANSVYVEKADGTLVTVPIAVEVKPNVAVIRDGFGGIKVNDTPSNDDEAINKKYADGKFVKNYSQYADHPASGVYTFSTDGDVTKDEVRQSTHDPVAGAVPQFDGNGRLHSDTPIDSDRNDTVVNKEYVYDKFVGRRVSTDDDYYVYGYHKSEQRAYQVAEGVVAHAVVSRFDNGDVLVPVTPTSNEGATSKTYVDNADAKKLDKSTSADGNFYLYGFYKSTQGTYLVSSGIVANALPFRNDNGDLLVPYTPATDDAAASKRYVDSHAFPSSGGTVQGDVIIAGNLTVTGENKSADVENLCVKDLLIEVGKDNPGFTFPAGLKYKYSVDGKYSALVWDADGIAHVGDVVLDTNGNVNLAASTQLQALATRPESGTDGGIMVWDNENKTMMIDGQTVTNLQGDIASLQEDKLDKVSTAVSDGKTRFYAIRTDGSQTTWYADTYDLTPYLLPLRADTGDIIVPLTPGSDSSATSKKYVDDAVKNLPDTSIKWSTTTALANDVSPVDAAAANCLSANRLAFGPASGVIVEYSNDGGSTWTDYGLTDEQKINLISLPSSAGPVLGHKSSGFTTNDQLRITLDANMLDIYTQARKLLVNFTTESASCYMKMETQLHNTEEWVTKDTYVIGGYSGWNSFPMDFAFGGNNSWGKHYVRLTFTMTALGDGSNAAQVIALYLIGDASWSTPSSMAYCGHLYKYDSDQNMIVPHIIYQNDTAVIDTIKNSTETFTTRDGSVTIPDYVKQKTNADGLYHIYAFTDQQTELTADSGPNPLTVPVRNSNGEVMTADPTTTYSAANKAYVDGGFVGKLQSQEGVYRVYANKPDGDSYYLVSNGAVAGTLAERTGDGRLQVGTPVDANDAATKNYVDNLILQGGTNKVVKIGTYADGGLSVSASKVGNVVTMFFTAVGNIDTGTYTITLPTACHSASISYDFGVRNDTTSAQLPLTVLGWAGESDIAEGSIISLTWNHSAKTFTFSVTATVSQMQYAIQYIAEDMTALNPSTSGKALATVESISNGVIHISTDYQGVGSIFDCDNFEVEIYNPLTNNIDLSACSISDDIKSISAQSMLSNPLAGGIMTCKDDVITLTGRKMGETLRTTCRVKRAREYLAIPVYQYCSGYQGDLIVHFGPGAMINTDTFNIDTLIDSTGTLRIPASMYSVESLLPMVLDAEIVWSEVNYRRPVTVTVNTANRINFFTGDLKISGSSMVSNYNQLYFGRTGNVNIADHDPTPRIVFGG